MTKRLAWGRGPAIVVLLAAAGFAAPAFAQGAAATATPVVVTAAGPSDTAAASAATPVASASVTSLAATPITPVAVPVAPVAAPVSTPVATAQAPILQVTATPGATVLQPASPGRAAILSSAPRPVTGTTPPTGTTDVRPAVTHAGLWPMVWAKQTGTALTEQEECIAIAVYHEARGEPLDGQLAVAEVIMNRAASGRYPLSWCEVVKQPWQFSFVNPRTGRMPGVKRDSAAWAYAQAITRIAVGNFADALPGDVLWYHADYVAPSWGRRLAKVEKIGAHIFYRAS